MLVRHLRSVVVFALALVACSSDEHHDGVATGATKDYVAVDAAKLCRLFTTDCPTKIAQSYDDCLAIYTAARVPSSCLAAVDAYACGSPASDLDGCFPACDADAGASVCDGDHLTQCAASNSRQYTYECRDVCATKKRTWSGECASGDCLCN